MKTAISILDAAKGHLADRAVTYDKPQGERSIGAAVEAFKAVTGDGLMNTAERGWMFMALLKMVRSQQGDYRPDNYEDGTAYTALMGEAAYQAHVAAGQGTLIGVDPAGGPDQTAIAIIGIAPGDPWYPDGRPWVEVRTNSVIPLGQLVHILTKSERECRVYANTRHDPRDVQWDNVVAYVPVSE